jgi:hypothetical protein
LQFDKKASDPFLSLEVEEDVEQLLPLLLLQSLVVFVSKLGARRRGGYDSFVFEATTGDGIVLMTALLYVPSELSPFFILE